LIIEIIHDIKLGVEGKMPTTTLTVEEVKEAARYTILTGEVENGLTIVVLWPPLRAIRKSERGRPVFIDAICVGGSYRDTVHLTGTPANCWRSPDRLELSPD
jgi:hypothetical protein